MLVSAAAGGNNLYVLVSMHEGYEKYSHRVLKPYASFEKSFLFRISSFIEIIGGSWF
jgi:hypothetical protein